jgi:hypothetical protein
MPAAVSDSAKALCTSLLLKTRAQAEFSQWLTLPWVKLLEPMNISNGQDSPWVLQFASTNQAEDGQAMSYGYVHFHKAHMLGQEVCAAIEAAWHAHTGNVAQVSRMQSQMKLAGASESAAAQHHYVVETDPEAGWDAEIYRWYNEEHMPGLSKVPGCVLAQRMLNLDHTPRSFACYDLTSADVMGCPPWLAVRGTAWSDVCRPHFTNTLRTRFPYTVTQTASQIL